MMYFNAILITTFILLHTTMVTAICSHTFQNCGAGCWNENGVVLSNGLRICAPVGKGYFSANNDNSRNVCPKGAFSGELEAEECSICPAGSASGGASSSCTLCPPGFYQELPGQSTCQQCSPALFAGAGSNNFVYDTETSTLLCALTGISPSSMPSDTPSVSPTSSPSPSPSELPTITDSSVPSQQPSLRPSRGPSSSPSLSLSLAPSHSPSTTPSILPTLMPSDTPSLDPSSAPSMTPTSVPSLSPSSLQPTAEAGFFLQVTFSSLLLLGLGFLLFFGLVLCACLCMCRCRRQRNKIAAAAVLQAAEDSIGVAIATEELPIHEYDDVNENKKVAYHTNAQAEQVLRVIEVHEAMIVNNTDELYHQSGNNINAADAAFACVV